MNADPELCNTAMSASHRQVFYANSRSLMPIKYSGLFLHINECAKPVMTTKHNQNTTKETGHWPCCVRVQILQIKFS